MKQLIALCCSAVARTMYSVAAETPNAISVQLLQQGLHDRPPDLRTCLQEYIDAVDQGEYEAVLLAYGMCGNSTIGLHARHTPLVIPRAHDCITLYLGSHDRYQTEFDRHPGTFWYSVDYLERADNGANSQLGAAGIADIESQYEIYVQKYGRTKADILIEEIRSWTRHYTRAAFIDTGLGDRRRYEQMAKTKAVSEGWLFEHIKGDRRLMEMLLNGDWPEDEFLIVPPGHSIAQAYDARLVYAVPSD